MKTSRRSIEKIVEDQVRQWNQFKIEKKESPKGISVITVSREFGSGGALVAAQLAKELGFDLFNREIIQEIAESANISARVLETLDEKGLSVLEDSIAAVIRDRHLWPDELLKHLMKVVGAIGSHGRAVIVGRGVQFVLPENETLKVRIVAPLNVRIGNVVRAMDVAESEAQKMILKNDSDRRSFIRKYFYADTRDPLNYDLVINTARMSIDAAVKSIVASLEEMNAE